MNITQIKENLVNQGIDIKSIDWESYSEDIPVEEWLINEYNIDLEDNLKEKVEAIKERQEYLDSKPQDKDLSFLKLLSTKSMIMTIIGKRGSGKTALGFYLLEQLKELTNKRICTVGFPELTPYKNYEDIEDVSSGSIALIDEGSMKFDARRSMSEGNIKLGNVLKIARHNDISVILITQNTADIEVRVLRMSDIFFLKEPSLVQTFFERSFIKRLYAHISPIFMNKESDHTPYYYIFSDKLQGLYKCDLPKFWTEGISKAHRTDKKEVIPSLFDKIKDKFKEKALNTVKSPFLVVSAKTNGGKKCISKE